MVYARVEVRLIDFIMSDPVVSTSIGYGDQSYWEKRYIDSLDLTYDWYMQWNDIKNILIPLINSTQQHNNHTSPNTDANTTATTTTDSITDISSNTINNHTINNHTQSTAPSATPRILVLGCGNSTLSADMLSDGYIDITSVDYSDTVINACNKRYAQQCQQHNKYKYINADVRNLNNNQLFASSTYDVIFDKGTLDSILCGVDSTKHSQSMLSECSRLLKPNGIYICITYGAPQNRTSILNKAKYNWSVEDQSLNNSRYMYICRRHKQT